MNALESVHENDDAVFAIRIHFLSLHHHIQNICWLFTGFMFINVRHFCISNKFNSSPFSTRYTMNINTSKMWIFSCLVGDFVHWLRFIGFNIICIYVHWFVSFFRSFHGIPNKNNSFQMQNHTNKFRRKETFLVYRILSHFMIIIKEEKSKYYFMEKYQSSIANCIRW